MAEIQAYIRPGKRAHLIGIGGVSMAPLAEVLKGAGVLVTGSDQNDSESVEHLRSIGIPVTIGHFPETVEENGAACVIRTAAVHDGNPEIQAARRLGLPVFERAQVWGAIMRSYKQALCISGTHGKTTTTSMCTHIAMAAHKDPTVMIGGTLPLLGAGHRVGQGDTIILESCEYCNSFLYFFPTVAVILNIDADHLDFFKDLDDIEHSFRAFADLVPDDGVIVANCEDVNTVKTLAGEQHRVVTFGLEHGDVHAEELTWDKGLPSFDVWAFGRRYAHVKLSIPGVHNVKNALAAAAAAAVMGLPGAAVENGLGAFRGAGRRLEYQGHYHGADLYDDYAHHPSEVRALLETAKTLDYKRVVCAFQPHTYSRTKALFDDFVEVLKLPDVTLLTEIFAAREDNIYGISAKDVAGQIPGAEFCPTLDALKARLEELAQPGDLILTVGAGDVYTVGKQMAEEGTA